MGIFASEPIGLTNAKCKNCGNVCDLGKERSYCPKCGKPIMGDHKSNLKNRDFPDLYNDFYNNNEDIFSHRSTEIFEKYIHSLYSEIEVETVPMINSSLRSGYSIRLAEEKAYKSLTLDKENDSLLEEARKFLKETDIKLGNLVSESKDILMLAILLTIEFRYEDYQVEKKAMRKHIDEIVRDNQNYLIPALKNVYEGKTMMYTLEGRLPHIFPQPVSFDDELKNRWIMNIYADTIFGYCVRLAESYISE